MLLTRQWVRGYLQGQKGLLRQLYHQAHFTGGDSPQNREPGAHCTAFRQLIKLGECLLQVPLGPKLTSSRQFLFSLQLTLAGRGLVNLLSFREFLKLLCCCLCLCLRSSHTGHFYHTGDSYTTACLVPMEAKRGCQTPWNWS